MPRRQRLDVGLQAGKGVFERAEEPRACRRESGGDRVRGIDDLRSRRISFGADGIAALRARNGIERGQISRPGKPQRSENRLFGRGDCQPRRLQTADQSRHWVYDGRFLAD